MQGTGVREVAPPSERSLTGCRAVVATSKKNACVSLVFSFLYKVVQVSQAPGATEGLLTGSAVCLPILATRGLQCPWGSWNPRKKTREGDATALSAPLPGEERGRNGKRGSG